jgi:hypothetical protein
MRRGIAATAVHDGVHEHAAGRHHFGGPHERKRRDVLDFASRVSRRQLDVGNHRVLWIRGIQLTVRLARDALVRRARRLHPCDLDLDDLGVRKGGAEQQRQRERRSESVDGHGRGPPRGIIA